jgi:hypothetical protein
MSPAMTVRSGREYGLDDVDLDAVDSALDSGDLDQVRRLLGLSQSAWRLLLSSL